MRSVAVLKVAAVLVPGILVRWWLEISEDSGPKNPYARRPRGPPFALSQLPFFLVVDAQFYVPLMISEEKWLRPSVQVVRSVLVEGIGLHRELAREVDAIMRLLEERSADANLGPVILRRPDSDSRDFAGSFIEEPLLDEGDPEAMAPRIAPEPSLTMLPRVPEETSATETYREVYSGMCSGTSPGQDRKPKWVVIKKFEAQLEHEEAMQAIIPVWMPSSSLRQVPELRPRLVQVNRQRENKTALSAVLADRSLFCF